MTASFQDILATLCSEITLLNEKGLQLSFSLATPQEAQIAYDILVAHGFDARVYHENGTSKLYINRPENPSEEKLAAALAHAETLRNILDTMQNVEPDAYHVSFTNTADMGKQIAIYFPSRQSATQQSSVIQSPRPQRAAYTPATSVMVERGRVVRKKHAMLAAGPTVTKKLLVHQQGGIKGWIHNYFASHIAENLLAFAAMFFLAIFTLSMVITSKGYLCPDLAVVKSKAWYCNLTISDLTKKKKDPNELINLPEPPPR